eukprot:CAMPEP_0170132970 /NCGR_PEP_ID=MMETSP0033_2-20121228/985_1 /TAXON_ID=195969 /ORGANISM="Dolichomastix tenuilepis, Strain CCMP3274" /LENGTH=241 /DNA_ID=CAMNT_0010368421 /DNA_START=96 /DNA_END=821 /DNA_ORIENTATION=+
MSEGAIRVLLPPAHTLEAVLFDIDGTLADSDPLHLRVFQEYLPELGCTETIDHAFFQKNISGRHNDDIFGRIFPDMPKERYAAVAEEKEARFRKLAGESTIATKGLSELLEWIDKRGLKKAAVTNAPRANAELMLKGMGLESYFDMLVIGSECTHAKPHPLPYLLALRHLGVSAEKAICFEDSPSGMRAAVSAGLATFGILSGQPREALEQEGAVECIKDFAAPELTRYLETSDVSAPAAA